MRSFIFTIFLMGTVHSVWCLDKLKQDYLVTYGDPKASIQVIHYFSFQCPHCVTLFQKEFKEIKTKYIDTNQVYWVFHPVPMDLPTVQGMDCLEKLSDREKKIFLEAILEETVLENSDFSVLMMQKAMEVFKKPIPKLQEKEYLSSTSAFQDAFKFLSQKEKITAIPTVEINGQLFIQEVPDIEFIEAKIKDRVEANHEI